jgi:hypothetical protein
LFQKLYVYKILVVAFKSQNILYIKKKIDFLMKRLKYSYIKCYYNFIRVQKVFWTGPRAGPIHPVLDASGLEILLDIED